MAKFLYVSFVCQNFNKGKLDKNSESAILLLQGISKCITILDWC